jgi:hypothetical protein
MLLQRDGPGVFRFKQVKKQLQENGITFGNSGSSTAREIFESSNAFFTSSTVDLGFSELHSSSDLLSFHLGDGPIAQESLYLG